MHGAEDWGRSLRPLGEPAMRPGDGPWWDALPEDFARRSERFELSGAQRLEVLGSAILDRAICTASATALLALFAPFARRRDLARQIDRFAFYAQDRFLRDPSSFFLDPARVPVHRRTARVLYAPRRAMCEDIVFEGAFEPVNPATRSAYLGHADNRRSHARHFFHADRPRPTVIALHGFWASPYWANAFVFEVPWLYRIGLDVVLPTLPFHGARRMRGALFSGHGFVSPHIDQTNEAVAHTVSDVRVLIRHLRERGVPEIGVTGVSLGGYLTALLASIEPSLAFAIPNVPVVSMVDLLMDWHPLAEVIRLALRRQGKTVAWARRLLAVHHALSYEPALPKERLMVIAGAGDRMAPPSQARLLWEHWQRPRAYYFPGNHLLHFDRGLYLRAMARFLARADVLPPKYRKAA
ncbi:MAG: alpha/beta hydrolase family protein [Deltaproteobacteria bacterium]|nr:alpha/beta hydrolase family protein [Deltaproteobacteria bacterium]